MPADVHDEHRVVGGDCIQQVTVRKHVVLQHQIVALHPLTLRQFAHAVGDRVQQRLGVLDLRRQQRGEI